MDIAKGLKRFFGINDDTLDDDLEYYGSGHPAYVNPFKKDNDESSDTAVDNSPYSPIKELPPEEVDTEDIVDDDPQVVPQEILDSLVTLINGNLSPLVVKHLDVEAQKRELMATLGDDFARWLQQARQNAVNEAAEQWNGDRADIVKKLEQADRAATGADAKLSELRERLTTTDAQRKAAQAQVTSLQQKVETLEAEKEQYDLENKSLLNKFKVMQVRGEMDDSDADLAEEIVRLKKQIEDLQQESEQKNEFNTNLINSLRADDAEKTKQVGLLQEELKQQEAERKALQEKLDEANADLEAAEEIQEKVEQFSDIMTRKTEELAAVKEQMKAAVAAEREKAEQQLDEARAQLEAKITVERDTNIRLQKEIDNLNKTAKEKAATRHDRDVETANTIDRLKAQLNEARSQHDNSRRREEMLLEQQKATQAQLDEALSTISRLNDTIAALQAQPDEPGETIETANVEPEPEPAPAEPVSMTEPMATPPSAIDALDDLDDLDWLQPTPPQAAAEPEPVEEPKPKHREHDSRQMSLF